VKYNGAAHPFAPMSGLEAGANCQRFAFELLRHFGHQIAPMRSSELLLDVRFTRSVNRPRAFDLLLFNRERKGWGAHVAVCLGSGRAIHLCRELGHAAIWTMDDFARHERYRTLVGIKRPTLKSRPK
jgi:hypothetical protein